jgi:hypothetical protein
MFRRIALAALYSLSFSIDATAQDMRPVAIIDPVLQTRAWTLMAPKDWVVDGTMMPGSSCSSGTTPIFRAVSADGKYGTYFLPRTDWAWGGAAHPGSDCLSFHEVVSARDYLTYLIRIENVSFVREEPVPGVEERRQKRAAMIRQGAINPNSSSDEARYRVRYSVAGADVEEFLTADVECSDSMVMGVGHSYACSTFVTRRFAPLGKLDAMQPMFEAMALTLDQGWMKAWTAAMVQRITRLSQQQTTAMLQQGDLAQQSRTSQQQAFMASSERGRETRNANFKEQQYQKQRNNDNFVDHILDCQRAYGTNGRISVGSNCPNRQTY